MAPRSSARKGKPVGEITDEMRTLAGDMIETMREANGVGLAAQQVGVAMQLTVLEVEVTEDRPSTMTVDGKDVNLADYMPIVLLDPVLVLGKEKEEGTEGCLSFSRDHGGDRNAPAGSRRRRGSSTGVSLNLRPPASSRGRSSTRPITSTASSSSTG